MKSARSPGWEERQEQLLSPAAARSSRARRAYPEPPERDDPFRAAYARDRDRILHARAFRRLKHKTQVFIPFEGDHFRTRLTHTLEVSQIARSVARALALNEDLTEAIALGHDLGHTPFGHSGEAVLDALLRGADPEFPLPAGVARETGAFKHNYQSVRVVDRLEKRYANPGLNLTHDVREGILKHTSWKRGFPFPLEFSDGLRLSSGGSLEAQTVNWCDEIAQQAHDLEDGLAMIPEAATERLEISRRIRGKRGLPEDPGLRRAELVRGLYREMVADLISASSGRIDAFLEKRRVDSAEAFERLRERLPGDLVGFSKEGLRRYRELKDFVYENIIHSFPIARCDGRARLVMRGLFLRFHENPRLLPDDVLAGYARERQIRFLRRVPLGEVAQEAEARYHRHPPFLRAIADYIAGMTDKFALTEYESLTSAFPSSAPL